MPQDSSIGLRIIFGIVVLIAIAVIGGYLHYTEFILKVSISIGVVVTVISIGSSILLEGDLDRRWWFLIGAPLLSVFVLDFLIWRIHSLLGQQIASKVQGAVIGLTAHFNESCGFVKLDFTNIDNGHIVMEIDKIRN